MENYVIVTDSCSDMPMELAEKYDIRILPLEFTISGENISHYADSRNMDPKTFYDRLRGGEMATTSAINPESYVQFISPMLEQGKDVIVFAFSSGLSSTYQNCRIAQEELQERFPERTIEVVDTLCASAGQAMMVYHAALKRDAGLTISQLKAWGEEERLHMAHWFTVDDLMFLKRGGRISAATAIMGSMLAIKPVLHVDDEGHLINVSKARGRKGALKAIVDKMGETADKLEDNVVFISHGDCLEDAKWVADELKSKYGVKQVYLSTIGPVIGAHSGPGTIAVFFTAKHR